jgi:hypothetical protein
MRVPIAVQLGLLVLFTALAGLAALAIATVSRALPVPLDISTLTQTVD